jgi:hypothetical protein
MLQSLSVAGKGNNSGLLSGMNDLRQPLLALIEAVDKPALGVAGGTLLL